MNMYIYYLTTKKIVPKIKNNWQQVLQSVPSLHSVGTKCAPMFSPSVLQFGVVWRGVVIALQHHTVSFQTAALKRHQPIAVSQIQHIGCLARTNTHTHVVTTATVGTYESESCISDSSYHQTFGLEADEEKETTRPCGVTVCSGVDAISSDEVLM